MSRALVVAALRAVVQLAAVAAVIVAVVRSVWIGSGNPVQAAAAQILVLLGLLAAETIAVAVILELVTRGRVRRPPAESDHQ